MDPQPRRTQDNVPLDKDINESSIGGKSKSRTKSFLLTFEIFNLNVHKCLVDSGASSNVMPLSVCKKINGKPIPSSSQIIQLYRTTVKVAGEMKNVLIRLVANERVCQYIDIMVVDIPEAYGLIMSRDWSEKLNGYFATDWPHLWLPYKCCQNHIKLLREPYMKYNVVTA